jgi:hypothetical protein
MFDSMRKNGSVSGTGSENRLFGKERQNPSSYDGMPSRVAAG